MIGHRWVAVLAGYDMTIEYLKGTDNKVVDILSWVHQCLDLETVTVLLNHAWMSRLSVPIPINVAVFSLLRYVGLEICIKTG